MTTNCKISLRQFLFYKRCKEGHWLEAMSNLAIQVPSRSLALQIFECSFFVAMNIISLTGNVIVCVAVHRNTRLRTTTNLYLFALATSDLLCAVFVMPLTSGTLISGRWIYGETACKIHGFVVLYFFHISPVTMGLMAFNRYIRIVKTNWYPRIFSAKRSFIYLGSIWCSVAAYMIIPSFFGVQRYDFFPLYAVCTVIHLDTQMRLGHYIFVTTTFLFVPLTIAFTCYYSVFKRIRQHNLDIAPFLQNRSRESRISVQEIRISKSLFGVVLGFAICWIPSYIVALFVRFKFVNDLHPSVALICITCIFLSSTINPFIYAGMNRAFRSEFKKLLFCQKQQASSVILPDSTVQGTTPKNTDIELQRMRPSNTF